MGTRIKSIFWVIFGIFAHFVGSWGSVGYPSLRGVGAMGSVVMSMVRPGLLIFQRGGSAKADTSIWLFVSIV